MCNCVLPAYGTKWFGDCNFSTSSMRCYIFLEKHPVFIPEVEVDEKEGNRGGGWPDGPRPLTPEHRHLLRRKAYSFPFLCEKSWNNCDDDEDEDDVGHQGKLVVDEVINDGGKSDLGSSIVQGYSAG